MFQNYFKFMDVQIENNKCFRMDIDNCGKSSLIDNKIM